MPGLLLALEGSIEVPAGEAEAWEYVFSRDRALECLAQELIDVIVIGPGVHGPLETAQLMHRSNAGVPLIIIGDSALREQLNLTPFLGRRVEFRSNTQGLFDLARSTALLSQKRRTHAAIQLRNERTVKELLSEGVDREVLLEALLENAPIGVVLLNAELKLLAANTEAKRLLAHSGRRVVGKLMESLIVEEDVEEFRQQIAGPSKRTDVAPLIRINSSEEVFHVELAWSPVAQPKSARLLIIHDVTERHHAELRAAEFEETMAQAQKTESLGVLAGGIAHDFNNLLLAISGHTELAMLETPESSPAYDSLNRVREATSRATDLAGQLLAYAGRRDIKKRELELHGVVEEMISILKTALPGRAELVLELKNSPPIYAGAATIQQVVMNLVMNAAEALEGKAGTITVSTGSCRITDSNPSGMEFGHAPTRGEYAALTVLDDGCGMSAETVDRIFDPFFTTKPEGHGLGLAAVVGIINNHGGSLRVRSTPGEGTLFTLLFPRAIAEPISTAPTANVSWLNINASGSVLVVDDMDGSRDIARLVLERVGFTVTAFAGGVAALEFARQHASDIDLVLLDNRMPELNGPDLLRELRKLKPQLSAILCSGLASDEDRRDFDAFLAKPYGAGLLIETACGLLGIQPTGL